MELRRKKRKLPGVEIFNAVVPGPPNGVYARENGTAWDSLGNLGDSPGARLAQDCIKKVECIDFEEIVSQEVV